MVNNNAIFAVTLLLGDTFVPQISVRQHQIKDLQKNIINTNKQKIVTRDLINRTTLKNLFLICPISII